LDEASISETVKKSRSRFGSMFLLFIQHAFAAHAEEFHNEIEADLVVEGGSFDPETLRKLMQDTEMVSGISVPMPVEICDLIPDIFICALHLSTSMKLIHYAETTLSERGTSELF